MDRRALLAIVISTLLIITYEIFFMPKPPPPEEQVEGERGESVPATGEITPIRQEEPRVEIPTEEAAPATGVEAAAEQIVFVSTPLYTMEIDTRGGLIRGIQLLRYTDKAGHPVALTNPQMPGGLGLILNTGDGEIDLRPVVFTADRDRVRIMADEEEAALVLAQTIDNGITIRRTYRFRGDSYSLDLEQQIARGATSPEIFSYRLLWEPGIAFTEGDPEYEKNETGAVTAVGTEVVRDRTGKVKEEGVQRTGDVRWTAVKGKYFTIALIPVNETTADVWIHRIPGEERVWFDAKFPVRSSGGAHQSFGLYAGPIDIEPLTAEGVGLERMIDFGWAPIQPISRLMLKSIIFLHRFVPNYGWVIVLISALTKVLFYRLTHKSFQSMKDMQKIQGQVQALKEKHKNDSQKMNKETWALYKREGVNPMGGCLPMLLQMPVFIALYTVLRSTIELRQAPFIFWITDLSRPDVLFQLPVPFPFIGSSFCLLPILMGISMFAQQKMTTVDPRQKMMIYFMPIMFTVLFYRLPSGLVLYWLVNNVFSIAQQWMIHRGSDKKPTGNDKQITTDTNGPDDRSKGRSNKGRGRKRSLSAKETS